MKPKKLSNIPVIPNKKPSVGSSDSSSVISSVGSSVGSSIVFWLLLENNKMKRSCLESFTHEKTASDFVAWVKENADLAEKEEGKPFVVVDCGIIR